MKKNQSYKNQTLNALDVNSTALLFDALSYSNYSKIRPDESFLEVSERLLGLSDNVSLCGRLASLMATMLEEREVFASQDSIMANKLVIFKCLSLSAVLPVSPKLSTLIASASGKVFDADQTLDYLQQVCQEAMYQQCVGNDYEALWVRCVNQIDLLKPEGENFILDAIEIETKYLKSNKGNLLTAFFRRLNDVIEAGPNDPVKLELREWGGAVMQNVVDLGYYPDDVLYRVWGELSETLKPHFQHFFHGADVAEELSNLKSKIRKPFNEIMKNTFDLSSYDCDEFTRQTYAPTGG